MREFMLLVAAVGGCLGHLCLLGPRQRGSMEGINQQGATDCSLQAGPCGGRNGSIPHIGYRPGSIMDITFQKNLNHWNKSSPGYFSISIGGSYGSLVEKQRIPDRNEPALHIYNTNITLPKIPDPFQLIQVRYVTNSTASPMTFYQCSEFEILTEGTPFFKLTEVDGRIMEDF